MPNVPAAGQIDNYPADKHSAGLASPGTGGVAVTYDADFAYVSRGIWCGAAGNLSVVMRDGSTVVFPGILAGTLLPIRARRVTTANTTIAAANLVALW